MNTINRKAVGVVVLAALLGLGGCAGMSHQESSTAVGAGVGAVGGAILGGGVLGATAGAVVGGVVGHEVGKR